MSIQLLTKVNKLVNSIMEKFCDRLRQLREEAGVSMSQLAAAVAVSDAAVCKWENGKAEPKVSYLIKLSEFFECSVDYLIGKTDDFDFPIQQGIVPPPKLTHKEKELLDAYRKLDSDKKNLILHTVDAWNSLDESGNN